MNVVFHYPLSRFSKSNRRALPCLDALWEGFRAQGIEPARIDQPDYQSCDLAVMVGMYKRCFPETYCRKNIIDQQQARGAHTMVIERGWVKRDKYESIGLDDINWRADFCLPRSVNIDRWDALGIELKPLACRDDGDWIIVIGQVPWDTSCQHVSQEDWVRDQVNAWKRQGFRIVFRPHPLAREAIQNTGADEVSSRSLKEDLSRAYIVVTFNSSVGVDAVLAGRRIVATDTGSMVWALTGDYKQYDRTRWAARLAHCQWTLDEMRSGEALRQFLVGIKV